MKAMTTARRISFPVTEETLAAGGGGVAAGEASRDVLRVIVAAAEGAKAAIAIDRALVEVHRKTAAVAMTAVS